jgi:hypothetical protein
LVGNGFVPGLPQRFHELCGGGQAVQQLPRDVVQAVAPRLVFHLRLDLREFLLVLRLVLLRRLGRFRALLLLFLALLLLVVFVHLRFGWLSHIQPPEKYVREK